MITEADSASYFYTGVQAQYKVGVVEILHQVLHRVITTKVDGKDLGHALEFKSEVQLSLDLPKAKSYLAFSYNHLSNASLGDQKTLGRIVICLIFLKSFNFSLMNLKDCHNFSDFRKLAKKRLPSPIFHYIDGAADDEITYLRNTSAFDDVDLVPNVLRGVENVDLSTTIFGKKIDLTILS